MSLAKVIFIHLSYYGKKSRSETETDILFIAHQQLYFGLGSEHKKHSGSLDRNVDKISETEGDALQLVEYLPYREEALAMVLSSL